jgi:hypothetical protein
MTAANDGAIEVHLADGGHVIVAFADPAAGTDPACDEILAALIHADGTEHDLERSIVDRAVAGGLSATVSATHSPTTVLIESRDGAGAGGSTAAPLPPAERR